MSDTDAIPLAIAALVGVGVVLSIVGAACRRVLGYQEERPPRMHGHGRETAYQLYRISRGLKALGDETRLITDSFVRLKRRESERPDLVLSDDAREALAARALADIDEPPVRVAEGPIDLKRPEGVGVPAAGSPAPDTERRARGHVLTE